MSTPEHLFNLLSVSLSNSNEARTEATTILKQKENEDGYIESLCDISLCENQGVPYPIRHLASVLLRNVIDNNWGYSTNPAENERFARELALKREYEEEDEDKEQYNNVTFLLEFWKFLFLFIFSVFYIFLGMKFSISTIWKIRKRKLKEEW